MGNIIEARCRCGFESGQIYQGGGMLTFQTINMEPAICKECKTFLILNYKEKDQKCPKCRGRIVFYNDRLLQKKPTRETQNTDSLFSSAFDWGDFKLPDVPCLCPNCGLLNMRFFFKGYWD